MLFSHLDLPTTYLPFSSMLKTIRLQASNLMIECSQTQPKPSINLTPFSLKNNSRFTCFSVPFNGRGLNGAFYHNISLGETPMKCEPKCVSTGLSEEQSSAIELPEENCKDDKEMQRRKKIGLANKGKVPWNKGIKHSAETRERIRRRTREALSDPKIRKKMRECPRSLSKQTKIRIRNSLKKLWGERLKWKVLVEKFVQSWAKSIAEAAKKGGEDQEELEWDSYDKIKREFSLQQIQWAEEKAKAKELKRLQAERADQAKIERMVRRDLRKKEKEKREKHKGETKTRKRRSKQERAEWAVNEELKLKARLVKIQKKKSLASNVSNQCQRAWEEFDLEFMQRENSKKEVSLEDQILLAKKKRSESLNDNVLMVSPSRSMERPSEVNSNTE